MKAMSTSGDEAEVVFNNESMDIAAVHEATPGQKGTFSIVQSRFGKSLPASFADRGTES